MPAGRPSDYNKEIATQICDLIASTPRGLDFICNQDDSLPSARTAHRWLQENMEFRQNYLRAKDRQADLIFDECLQISDDGTNDTYVDGDGNKRVDYDVIARSKLRVETRLRIAGKLNPKKYGDKTEVEHTGAIDHNIRLTEEQRMVLIERKRASVERRLKEKSEAPEPADTPLLTDRPTEADGERK